MTPLKRLELGGGGPDGQRREAFIQELVHMRPEVIPMADIEPAYTPMISICRELETSAGFVDNLWLTPAGGIIIGECKLVRNPQARREVLSQALDYARAISTWHYEFLENASRKAQTQPQRTLWELVKDETDLDEVQFVDAIERRLKSSRFMVLIIGDGIQEGVESLTNYLQLHAGLHVGVALVDLSIWQTPYNDLLVVPRVPLRTVLVERGIVVVNNPSDARVEPPRQTGLTKSAPPRATTASEPEFYEQLEDRRPGLAQQLRSFLDSLADIAVTPEFRKSVNLRFWPSPDLQGSFGFIDTSGKVWSSTTWNTANRAGRLDAGEKYLTELAKIVGGTVRRYEKNWPDVVNSQGKAVDLTQLLSEADEWKKAMARFMTALKLHGELPSSA